MRQQLKWYPFGRSVANVEVAFKLPLCTRWRISGANINRHPLPAQWYSLNDMADSVSIHNVLYIVCAVQPRSHARVGLQKSTNCD